MTLLQTELNSDPICSSIGDAVVPIKPVPIKISPAKIPKGLKVLKQWVGWKYILKANKWTKPPYHVSGKWFASVDKPSSWSTFEDALAAHDAGLIDGIGFVFAEDDGYAGIDLDHCIDFLTKKFTQDDAESIVQKLIKVAYVERSVGGDGLHLIVKGSHIRSGKAGGNRNWIEGYDGLSKRYFTVTGFWLPSSQPEPLDAQNELEWFYESFLKKSESLTAAPRNTINNEGKSADFDCGGVQSHEVGKIVFWAKEHNFGSVWRQFGQKPHLLDTIFDIVWKEQFASHSDLDMKFFGTIAWYAVLTLKIPDDRVAATLMKVYRQWPGYRDLEGERKNEYTINKVLNSAFKERDKIKASGGWCVTEELSCHELTSKRNIDSVESEFLVRRDALNYAITGRPIEEFLEEGDGSERFVRCVEDAYQKVAHELARNSITINGLTKSITRLQEIQHRYSILSMKRKRPVILDSTKDTLTSKDEVRLLLGGQAVLVGFNDDEEPIYKEAYCAWEGSRGRRHLTEAVMTRKPIENYQWNLFPGFGVIPTQSECPLILNHIKEVICSNDTVIYEAMLNLIAWQFQNVGKPSRIIVGLRSKKQQVGKNIFTDRILGRCLGYAYYYSNDANRAFGQFNAQMRGVVILCLDEAVFAKDKALAAKIKSAVQASELPSEDKFITTVPLPSGLNLWILTNEQHVAHLDSQDARHWLLNVSEHRKGNQDYFTNLADEIDNGGVEAFLDLMINRDISGFIPQKDLPRDTEALFQAKELSLGELSAQQWLMECVASEFMLGLESHPTIHYQKSNGTYLMAYSEWPGDFGLSLLSGDIYQAYKIWCSNTKSYGRSPDAPSNFWRVLTDVGFISTKQNGSRLRQVPTLAILEVMLNDCISGR